MTATQRKQFAQAKLVCQAQRITMNGPGTILKDFQAIVQLVGDGVPLSGKSAAFPQPILPALNAAMCDPMQMPLKRPLMKDYPNISGIYILLRSLGLLKVERKKLVLDSTQLERWKVLNPVEQYFSLLRAWMLWADTNMLGGAPTRGKTEPQLLSFLSHLATWPTSTWKDTYFIKDFASSRGMLDSWRFQLAIRFGLARVRDDGEREPGQSPNWRPSAMKATTWGQAVASTAVETFIESDPECTYHPPFLSQLPDHVEELMIEAFMPYYPDLNRTLLPPEIPVKEGGFFFKVTMDDYPGVSRTIFSLSESFLDQLASNLLAAFDFDADHMYEFSYRDFSGARRVYLCPYYDEGESAAEISLAKAGLPENPVLHFRFDFGDDWRFTLRGVKRPVLEAPIEDGAVVASEGEAPKQYGAGM